MPASHLTGPGGAGSSRLSRIRLPVLVLLATGLVGLATVAERPLKTLPTPSAPPDGYRVRLVFAGDIMLDNLPGEAVARGEDPFAEFAEILAAADLAVGNLECVISTTGAKDPKPFTFRAHPRVLPLLARHFDALSLANNHSVDFGHVGFLQQLRLLKKYKIPYFGGGEDVREARTPLLLIRGGLRLALLGYSEFPPRRFEAGPHWPGVAWAVDEQVVADLKAARSIHNADLVIPFLHWGRGEEPPTDRQKALARLMIDNGADLVVGSHPHVTQGAEYYKGKLIVYSLGNFVFDGFDTEETRTGWLLRVTLSAKGVEEWDTVVARIDERGIPHLAKDVRSPFGRGGVKEIGRRAFQK